MPETFTLTEGETATVERTVTDPNLNDTLTASGALALVNGSPAEDFGGGTPLAGDTWYGEGSADYAPAQYLQSFSGVAVAAMGGYIYGMGGVLSGPPSNYTTRFDLASNSWAYLAALPQSRTYGSAFALDGYVYYVGGDNSGAIQTTVYRYDPTEATWQTVAPLPGARYIGGAVSYGGKGYWVLGHDGSAIRGEIFEYDPDADTWTQVFTTADTSLQRAKLGCAVDSGSIYIVGGGAADGATKSDVLVYDIAAGTLSDTGWILPAARQRLSAEVLDGSLYAIGGTDSAGAEQADVYRIALDAASGTEATPVASLPLARRYPAAVAESGLIYAITGHDGSAYLDDVTAYAPAGGATIPGTGAEPDLSWLTLATVDDGAVEEHLQQRLQITVDAWAAKAAGVDSFTVEATADDGVHEPSVRSFAFTLSDTLSG